MWVATSSHGSFLFVFMCLAINYRAEISQGRCLRNLSLNISTPEKLSKELEEIKQLSAKVKATSELVDKKTKYASDSKAVVGAILQ